ncbi:unnamed protein product [Rhizopus stolonifer]
MEQFLAGLDNLLTKLAQAQDSETIRNATSLLNTQYYVTGDCVPALVEIISHLLISKCVNWLLLN